MDILAPVAEYMTLPDSHEPATIRQATRADVALLTQLLLRLGDHSRYLRYHAAWHMTQEAAQHEAERMLTGDGGRLALLVLCRRDDEHEAVAVGELVPAGDGSAELALLVRDDLQRRGIGIRLGQALIAGARALGVRQVRADVLAENRGARRLLGCLGLNRQIGAGYGTLQLEAALQV